MSTHSPPNTQSRRSRCCEQRLNNKLKKTENYLNTDNAKSKTSVLTKMSASFTLWVRFTKLAMLAVVCRLLYSRTHCCANSETQMVCSVISSICYSTLSAVCWWIPPQSQSQDSVVDNSRKTKCDGWEKYAINLKPNAQRKTELNLTGSFSSVELSWVELSWVQFSLCIGLYETSAHGEYIVTNFGRQKHQQPLQTHHGSAVSYFWYGS